MRFRDRSDAGRLLAVKLAAYASRPDVQVLALPGAAVRVAFEVACALDAPLDVVAVGRLQGLGRRDGNAGAMATGSVCDLDEAVVGALGIPRRVVEALTSNERWKRESCDRAYRGERPEAPIRDRTVILVDDGGFAAQGVLRAAIRSARQHEPRRIVVGLAVASRMICDELEHDADEVVCAVTTEHGLLSERWYGDDVTPTEEDVRALLDEAAHGQLTARR
ncbi:MAG: phosphoribosyltransferase [Planctomycetes bacterium]|nr:phosphoribosyltransferase [Planctomycetota bacterium]MBI3844825.1 phosphoribosyltransferase [Planctomycetota bacterium]